MIIEKIEANDLLTFFGPAMGLSIDEVQITADAEGLSMRCVDPAHVAMMDAKLTVATWLDEPAQFVVDLRDLSKVLGLFKGDTVDLRVDAGRLTIIAPGKRRSIRLVDREVGAPKVPQLELETIEVPNDELKAAVKFGGDISDHFVLDSLGGRLVVMSSDDMDTAEYDLGETSVSMRVGIPADYLASIVKGLPSGGVSVLGVATDYPMRIQSRTDKVSLMCLIAPRIEKD